MRLSRTLAVMAIAATSVAAMPALADPGHGKGKAIYAGEFTVTEALKAARGE